MRFIMIANLITMIGLATTELGEVSYVTATKARDRSIVKHADPATDRDPTKNISLLMKEVDNIVNEQSDLGRYQAILDITPYRMNKTEQVIILDMMKNAGFSGTWDNVDVVKSKGKTETRVFLLIAW